MKTSLVLGIALCCAVSTAQAVKFNPEAMQTMRAEGERLAAQALQPRRFQLPGGACLQRAGDGNAITAPCNPQDPAQVWRFDEMGRLIHNASSLCLAVNGPPGGAGSNVLTRGCDNAPQAIWRLRGNGQLVNAGSACLHADGDINAGGNVLLRGCQEIPRQFWR